MHRTCSPYKEAELGANQAESLKASSQYDARPCVAMRVVASRRVEKRRVNAGQFTKRAL